MPPQPLGPPGELSDRKGWSVHIVGRRGRQVVQLVFGGAVLTQSLIGVPGVGRELVRAVKAVDQPVVVGRVLVSGFFVVPANAVADMLSAPAGRRVVLS